MQRGFAIVPLVLLLVLIFGIVFVAIKNGLIKLSPQVTLQSTPSPSVEQSPLPTVSATPTVTAAPTKLPTPKATISPTVPPVSGPPGAGLSTITVATEKGNFSATVLSLNLSGVRVITDTGNDDDCGTNCPVFPLLTYIQRNGGFGGVNGTYFCPSTYPECASKSNSFDFPVYNSRLGKWINSGNLSWNARSMLYFDGGGAHYLQNANSYGGGANAGIVNHPGLVDGGNVQIDEAQSGLSDKQKAVGTKNGIGMRGPNDIMVVVAKNVTMYQFAHVFKALAATNALNLDVGGSTALYFGGRYVYGPGREIPNAIIFANK